MKRTKKDVNAILKGWGKPKGVFFNFDLIKEYFLSAKTTDQQHYLSEKTLNDLDFSEYFKFVDRTNSAIGQQYLYTQLRNLNRTKEYLVHAEKRVEHYNANEKERVEIQQILKGLSTSNDYYFPFLIFGELPTKNKYLWVIKIIQVLMIIGLAVSFKFPVVLIPLLLLLGVNLILHYRHKNHIGNFAHIFSRLTKLTQASKKLIPYCEKPAPTKDTLQQEVKQIEKITSKVLFLKTDNLQHNEITSILWYAIELLKIITLAEITTFHKLVDEIESARTQIKDLYVFIAEIDIAISTESLRVGLPYYAIPNFVDPTKEIELKGLFHPLVEGCVDNNLHLKERSLLLTGSNMSEKSTFIKAINLNIINAQVLNTSFTKSYIAPFFAIETSIIIDDDLKEKKSYFMEEVLSVGNLIELSKQEDVQYLFTIDEVFKGTNTIERISSAKAILDYLNKKQHIVLVSTHDIELTQLLKNKYELYYFQESIADKSLTFDYKLKQGALKNRNAINILEIANYPEEIITQSKALALTFEKEKTGLL